MRGWSWAVREERKGQQKVATGDTIRERGKFSNLKATFDSINCQSYRQDLSRSHTYVPQRSPEGKDFPHLDLPSCWESRFGMVEHVYPHWDG